MNFKGKRFCQRTSRGCLNFLHKQVFRCCSLLCIPPVSLAPIFITFFVWLFFGCVFGLFLGGGGCLFVCFKSFRFGSKESFTKGSKAGTSLKTMWWRRGPMQRWMPAKLFPPSPDLSCDCFMLPYVQKPSL